MIIFGHALSFIISAAIIWFFAGLIIDSVDRVAKFLNKSGFIVAFFVLGFLTSIGEMSVMVNATINGVPQISAGNLSGASLVILLGIIPILAILGNGIELKRTIHKNHLALALLVIALPTLFLVDGAVSVLEGIVIFIAYGFSLYVIRNDGGHALLETAESHNGNTVHHNSRKTLWYDFSKIVIGAVLIFIAGHFLVEEAVFFSELLHVPPSLIGLLLLSIGTNVPEIVIAVRAILQHRSDIAFGDYLGSALMNTLIFSVLVIVNRGFSVVSGQFIFTSILMVIGFFALFNLAVSGRTISREEGKTLFFFYVIFLIGQASAFIKFADM